MVKFPDVEFIPESGPPSVVVVYGIIRGLKLKYDKLDWGIIVNSYNV